MTHSVIPRIAAIDAYRGLVMFLMLAEVLHFGTVARKLPDSPTWTFLAEQQSHVEWQGCTLHDLIQPSFSFLVGTSLVFSLKHRRDEKSAVWTIFGHAAWRALILILLGVFLRSVSKKQTYWTFEDTLTQIGLGYLPLVAFAFLKPRWQIGIAAFLLVGYFVMFAAYPAPTADDVAMNRIPGAPATWPHHTTGFMAHWDKNANLAWKFDTWFLNLFPREKAFEFHPGGYSTLSFIPTLVTMLLGLFAGQLLLMGIDRKLIGRLFVIGLVMLIAGFALDWAGICPIVKRIWTPSWTLFSGGWCYLILMLFTMTTDWIGKSGWSYPLRVIGANSLFAYVGSHLAEPFLITTLKTHLGVKAFQIFGEAYEPVVIGSVVLVIYGLILWWMDVRKIYVRI
jgi:heparan-alpha-glucosaminide N-acetyltransferase